MSKRKLARGPGPNLLRDGMKLHFDRRQNVIFIMIGFAISLFLMILGNWKLQARINAIKEPNAIFVTIYDMDCNPYKGHSSVLFRINGSNNSVNMAGSVCLRFKVGEQIKVYDAGDGVYFIENDGLEEEDYMTLNAGIMLLIGLVIHILWVIYFKQYFSNLIYLWQSRQKRTL